MCLEIKNCWWCKKNLKTRSKIIAILAMIGAISNLIFGIIFLSGYGHNFIHNGMSFFLTLAYILAKFITIFGIHATIWLWIVFHLLLMGLDILLIYGILKKKLVLLLCWLFVHVLSLVVSLIRDSSKMDMTLKPKISISDYFKNMKQRHKYYFYWLSGHL